MTLHTLFETSLNKPLQGIFIRLFDVRKGEVRKVVLMQVTIFLLIATLLVIKPTINALFLSDVGIRKLPLAFILVAVFAGVMTTFYSRILNRIPLNKVIQFTLVVSVVLIVIFSVLLRLDLLDTWILYVFYVWVAVFGVLSASQFWILANVIFNAREARRLFSVIGGAAIGGGIFGGYLTSVLAPLIGSENVLFVGAFFLILCIPLFRAIWNSNKAVTSSVYRRKQRMGKVSERPYRLVLSSKHLTYLAGITALSVLVAKLVDYQFSAISSMRILDEDELAAFFGFWFSNFNLLSLLIQLFLTRRIVGVYGVGVSLFFLPVGIFAGAVAILISPGLFSAVLIKASDGSLKQSVNKSAIELLAFPIPSDIKNQAKTFIDVFVDAIATGISGLLLVFFVNGLHLPVRFVSVVILLLLLVWFKMISRIRNEYIDQFRKKLNLNGDAEETERRDPDLPRTSVFEGMTQVLENGTDDQIHYVLKNLTDVQHETLFPSILGLLSHPSPDIVSEAIRKLYDYKAENLSEQMTGLLSSDHLDVQVAAIEYLIEHAEDRMELIRTYREHPDRSVANAALVALANETRDNEILRTSSGLIESIGKKIKELPKQPDPESRARETELLLRITGAPGLAEFHPFLSECLKNPDVHLRKLAIRAAGKTLDTRFLPELLFYVKDKQLRATALEAIAGFGFRVFDYLKEQIVREKIGTEIVRELPVVAEKIGTQYAVDFLFALLEYPNDAVRTLTIQSLYRLKSAAPHLVFYNKRIIQNIYEEAILFMNMHSALHIQQEKMDHEEVSGQREVYDARKNLMDLLDRRLDENLTRIFKFLGLKYPPEEIDTIYREIRNPKEEMRINALEFLDNMLETDLKRILIPLIETSLTESISKEALDGLHIHITSQSDCFSMLLDGHDTKVKLAVLYLISTLKDREYLPLARTCMNHADARIRRFSHIAVEAMLTGPEREELHPGGYPY
ncbi:MAG: hypothetical protein R2751_00465 [Bacteroidales bacterium]